MRNACPCLYAEVPCHNRCSCLLSLSSSGCRRCCSHGSVEQKREMAEHLAKVIDAAHSPPEWVGDEDDLDEHLNEWGFIPLDGGRLYVRQSSIEGIRWISEEIEAGWDGLAMKIGKRWHLELVLSDVPRPLHVYGDDAASVMRVLGLPEEPPGG